VTPGPVIPVVTTGPVIPVATPGPAVLCSKLSFREPSIRISDWCKLEYFRV
jgi:hypothetical protein